MAFLLLRAVGRDADPREHEDGGQPKQGEVDPKTAGALQDGGHAEQQRHQPQHRDGQRHPAVAGLAAEVGPLAAGGPCSAPGPARAFGPDSRRRPPGRGGSAGPSWVSSGFLRAARSCSRRARRASAAALTSLISGWARPMQSSIWSTLLFVFEVALFLPAAVVLHHQVGDGGKDPFLGKAALAHGHPLEHPGDGRIGDVIAPVDVKAVEIQRLFSDAAGAELFAVFLVGGQGVGVQGRAAQAGQV